MPLRFSNGEPVSQGRFIVAESDVIKQWPPVQSSPDRWEAGDAIDAWVRLFGAAARDLCAQFNVPVDVMTERLVAFQAAIKEDMEVIKWAESMRATRNVGWEGAAKMVGTHVETLPDGVGIRLSLAFPFIPTPSQPSGDSTVRCVDFTIGNTP